jgi:hypothetical protein
MAQDSEGICVDNDQILNVLNPDQIEVETGGGSRSSNAATPIDSIAAIDERISIWFR